MALSLLHPVIPARETSAKINWIDGLKNYCEWKGTNRLDYDWVWRLLICILISIKNSDHLLMEKYDLVVNVGLD